MKKSILILTSAVALFFAACNSAGTSSDKATADSAAATVADTTGARTAGIVYTCPMHPEVVSNKPGKCPKCKMDLVVKESSSDTDK